MLFAKDKILSDEIIDSLYNAFTNNDPDRKNHLIHFNADDKVIENILNECSNTGLFSDKKVVVIRNVKRFLKNEKIAVAEYIKRPNPDTFLILISNDDETDADKIFAADSFLSKSDPDGIKSFTDKINILKPDVFSEDELLDWVIKSLTE
ncbi:MAG: hypothetical protein IPM96_13550 [Ignavibacteria bacterium]|nr:hypothetical protein [Ignavibacteria bacterium]